MSRLPLLRIVLLLSALTCGARDTASAASPDERPAVPVLLTNEAGADQRLIDSAKAETARLYALIGVDLVWVAKVTSPDPRLRVISLVAWEPAKGKLASSVLGFAPARPGHRGVMAYVFVSRIERTAQKFKARLDHVLAIAIAHELGHMLLPDGAHARTGLMRANWDNIDFGSASAGLLVFSRETAALIRIGQAAAASLSAHVVVPAPAPR